MNHAYFLVRLAAFALLGSSLHAQGSLVVANYSPVAGINAPVYDEDGATRLAGATYLAQLYLGTSPSSLSPVAEAIPFRTGGAAGYITPTTITLPGIKPGTLVYAELRAWDTTAGATYEAALTAGGKAGASATFTVVPTPSTEAPAQLVGLDSFQLATIIPVRILSQPGATLAPVGGQLSFAVEVDGTPPLEYQWWKDGLPIDGATGAVLDFPAATLADSGAYTVVVSNPWTSATSEPAGLTVLIPPAIVTPPASQTSWPGGSASFRVEAIGDAPLSYQWRFDGTDLPGANDPTLELAELSTEQAGTYTVVVENPVGSVTSDPAELTIAFLLAIGTTDGGAVRAEPDLALYPAGSEVTLHPEAIDGFEFAEWLGDGSGVESPFRLTMDANRTVSASFAAVNGTVNLRNLHADAGVDAPVFDEDGVTRLAGDAFAARLYGGATAETMQPTGPPVRFGVGAAAGYVETALRAVPPVLPGGLAYVQLRAWESGAGDTYEEATIAGGRAGRSAVFSVVTGGDGSPPSELTGLESFALIRGVPVDILEGPADRTIAVGDTLLLNVVATGDPPLAYQWFFDDAPIEGAVESSLNLVGAGLGDSGRYAVEVANSFSQARSAPATVRVLEPPAIFGEPAGQIVIAGNDLELAVEATGTEPAYQWFFNDEPIPGANKATLRLKSAAPAQAGSYVVEVTNAVGTVRSADAMVEVHFLLTLTPAPGGRVQADPAPPSYPPDTVVTLAPVPYDGFAFVEWLADAAGDAVPLEFLMDGHHEVSATFGPVNGTVDFRNLNVSAGLDAPVFDEDETTRIEGEGFLAQLYGGATPETLQPTGPPVPFRSEAAAGYIEGAVRAVPPVVPGGLAHVQMRAWERAAGESYEEALAAGGRTGRSTVFSVVTGGAGTPPTFPAELLGLESFHLVRAFPPRIVLDPVSTTVIVGLPATFNAAFDGTPPLTARWFKDDVEIEGATTSEFTLTAAQVRDAGVYHLVVSSPWGTARSADATLSVRVPPIIRDLDLQPEVLYGADLALTVTATGSPPRHYQWFAGVSGDESNPVGEDSPTLQLSGVVVAMPYWVRVANDAGQADSDTILPVIIRLPQTITFPPIGNLAYGTPPVPLGASSSFGLPIAYAVTAGPGEIVDETLVITGVGVVSVLASQPGNEQFLPADPVAQDIVVTKGVATVLLSGLEQPYDGTPRSAGVVTAPPGLGIALTYDGSPNPPVDAGSYLVRAEVLDGFYVGAAEATLQIARATQIVTFDPLPDRTYGDGPFTVGATANSGLPVTIEVASGPASLAGNLLTIESAGLVTLRASQAGDANHQPAETEAAFLVAKAPATLTLAGLTRTYDGAPKAVSAEADPAGLTIAITYDGAPNAPVNAGSYAVHAEVVDVNYRSATDATLLIAKAAQTITFTPLPDRTIEDAPFTVGATASSGLPVTLEVISGPASLAGDVLTLAGAGVVTLRATQAGDANHNPTQAEAGFSVTKAPATIILTGLTGTYDGTPKAVTALTEPAGLAVAINYDGSPDAPVNAGSYTVRVDVIDDHYAGSMSDTLLIAKVTQSITLGPLPDRTFGDAPLTVGATASSGLPVALEVVSGPASLAGNLLTIQGAGAVTLRATQAGDANHNPAQIEAGFSIARAPASITLENLVHTYDGASKSAGAVTQPTGLSVVLTYDGSPNPPVDAGAYAVSAEVTDNNYFGSADGTLQIAQATQTITLDPLPDRTFGDDPFTVGATASSGLPVTLEVAAGPASLAGNLLSLEGAGIVTLHATQTGNGNYQPAQVGASFVVSKAIATLTLAELNRTYDGAPKSALATTHPPGLTVSLTYDGSPNPPVNAGRYAVLAEVTDANYSGSTTDTLLIARATQTITLDPLPNRTFGDAPFTVGATASSELPVTLEVAAGPASLAGNLVTIEGAGAVTLRAIQPGDDNHDPAETTAGFTVARAAARIILADLTRTYDGTPKPVGATTEPDGLTVEVTYDGSPEAPANAGLYAVHAEIVDTNYSGAVDDSLVIAKAAATVELAGLDRLYDGLPKPVVVTTVPSGLAVDVTYDGLAEPPVEPGVYAVAAAVTDPNHTGSASASMVIRAEITGFAWDDLDGDGRRAPGEPGLPAVQVRLFDAEGTAQIDAALTDEAGLFTFAGLALGTYVVEETDPADFASTTPNRRSVILDEHSQAAVGFGDQRLRTVVGLVFNDHNANGLPDDGEPGLAGVEIRLVDPAGNVIASATSGTDGSYRIEGVAPGAYELRETDAPGYTSTTPNTRSISLVGGAASASFGDRPAGGISGVVFIDAQANGVPDAGESGLPGITVRLSGATDELVTETDAEGHYGFTELPAGAYTVRLETPEGHLTTSPAQRRIPLTETTSGTADFGLQPLGMVGGIVFDDINGSGVRDPGEPGLGGVTVFLVDADGNGMETRTEPSGAYQFTPNSSGLHSVIEVDPVGFTSTSPNLRQINVTGDGAAFVSFADQGLGQVAGAVFNDLNGNGRRDLGELGLGGVRVRLVGDLSNRLALTSSDGVYVFGNVEPGAYEVQELDPIGFTSTTPNLRHVILPAGSSAAAHFGDQQAGTISGRAYEDTNGNGFSEPGEPGLPGVTVRLVNEDEAWTTTTSSDGVFVFSGIAAGVYTVEESAPAGFASTTPDQRRVNLEPGGAATASFGNQPKQTIAGSVFEDRNGNGLQDPDESGIADVEVELLDGDSGESLATTATTTNGGFSFADLAPGAYTIRPIVPAGYTTVWRTGLLARVTLSGNPDASPVEQLLDLTADGAASASFALLATGSITGMVFVDADANEAFTAGEQVLTGVNVQVWTASGAEPLLEVGTTGDGSFAFAGLPAGAYTVIQAAVPGYHRTAPERAVVIPEGGAATIAFANRREGAISGRVFHDENADGRANPTEPGLGQITVRLTSDSGTVLTTKTSGDGRFAFTRLAPGTYTALQSVPAHFSNTTPNPVEIPLAAGEAGAASFGNLTVRPPAPSLTLLAGDDGTPRTIRVQTEDGRTYALEAGNNLREWETITTKRADGPTLDFTDPTPPGQYRFYRVRLQ
ncbi:MAG: hypothetical protein H7A47_01105 [Verrucomicrobiales bacterium]|nr:hypothetical protein [Verrucomicrobiales bacterium]